MDGRNIGTSRLRCMFLDPEFWFLAIVCIGSVVESFWAEVIAQASGSYESLLLAWESGLGTRSRWRGWDSVAGRWRNFLCVCIAIIWFNVLRRTQYSTSLYKTGNYLLFDYSHSPSFEIIRDLLSFSKKALGTQELFSIPSPLYH